MELFQRLHFLCIRRGKKKEQEETSEFWRGREEIFRIHQKNNAASE